MNVLHYKNYTGVFDFMPGDDAFHGRVVGLRDVVHFSGRSLEELQKSLAQGVEDYLAMCAEEGVSPEKPLSGKIGLRLGPELHGRAATAAKAAGKSLNSWIAEVIDKESRPNQPA